VGRLIVLIVTHMARHVKALVRVLVELYAQTADRNTQSLCGARAVALAKRKCQQDMITLNIGQCLMIAKGSYLRLHPNHPPRLKN
jgi:hypothetical protein